MPDNDAIVEMQNIVAASIRAMSKMDSASLKNMASKAFGERFNAILSQAIEAAPSVRKDRWPSPVQPHGEMTGVSEVRMIELLTYYEQLDAIMSDANPPTYS